MYNSNNSLKTSLSWWQYYWDEPVFRNAAAIIDFATDGNNNVLFNFQHIYVFACNFINSRRQGNENL